MTDYEVEAEGTVTSASTGYASTTSRSSQVSFDLAKSGKLIRGKSANGSHSGEPKVAIAYLKQTSRQRYEWGKRIRLILALVGILGIVAVIFVLSFYLPSKPDEATPSAPERFLAFNSLDIDLFTSTLQFFNPNGVGALNVSTSEDLSSLDGRTIKSGNTSLFVSGSSYTFNVHFEDMCWNVTWFYKANKIFQDCFEAANTNWYGAAELYDQAWPLERGSIKSAPFISRDLLADKERLGQGFGGVLEPYFLNSRGAAVFVRRDVHLHVSINENNNKKVCIRADNEGYLAKKEAKNITLAYTVCVGKDVRDVHTKMISKFIEFPQGVPDIDMMTKPIWSTWARYKKDINQKKVEKFVDEIVENNMPASQIEIDDMYSTSYGDLNFDSKKFPTPGDMIRKIHDKQFRVTVWVYPFANVGSHAMASGMPYWIKKPSGVPELVQWWNGIGTVLDTTNPEATRWFISRLKSFQDKFKINSFKFDAGEASYIPEETKLNSTIINPNYFSTYYVKMASSFRGLAECRVAYHSQQYPLFVRMLDRTSTWGSRNGLKSVISATLTFGLLGYPFVLPDMVGGDAYDGNPDKELYVRWAQLSVFLPAIQFSIPPWDYDDETLSLVLKALQIRYSLKIDFLQFLKEVTISGTPIIRPLWWIAPTDPIALTDDTQFMFGNKYLVAPVVEKGATNRQVYLPAGSWKEQFGNYQTIKSSGAYFNYKVALKDILYFELEV